MCRRSIEYRTIPYFPGVAAQALDAVLRRPVFNVVIYMESFWVTFPGYILALAGFVFALFQFRLRKQADMEQLQMRHHFEEAATMREQRFAAYREYLGKLDRIHAAIVSPPIRAPDAEDPQKTGRKVATFVVHWGQEHNKALEELSGLRLVCSEPILILLDEYTTVAESYVRGTVERLQHLEDDPASYLQRSVWLPLLADRERLQQLKRRMEAQMRLDIGAD